jgi:hypothetical protein
LLRYYLFFRRREKLIAQVINQSCLVDFPLYIKQLFLGAGMDYLAYHEDVVADIPFVIQAALKMAYALFYQRRAREFIRSHGVQVRFLEFVRIPSGMRAAIIHLIE